MVDNKKEDLVDSICNQCKGMSLSPTIPIKRKCLPKRITSNNVNFLINYKKLKN